MSLPYYVSPEQVMKDRAEYARKGIQRGRSVIVARYRDGIVMIADNPSQSLKKIGEIYDRIAFAAVGRYHEFEQLRMEGIRYADLRGYAYDRRDVTAQGLANHYAQRLGYAFSSSIDKPFEVELVVAEIADSCEDDRIFTIGFDGTITDEADLAIIGGQSHLWRDYLSENYRPQMDLNQLIATVSSLMGQRSCLEIACLDRTMKKRRRFRRISSQTIDDILTGSVVFDESSPDGSQR